jgi:hypothetical protein
MQFRRHVNACTGVLGKDEVTSSILVNGSIFSMTCGACMEFHGALT